MNTTIAVATGTDYDWTVTDNMGTTDNYMGTSCDCTGTIGELVYTDADAMEQPMWEGCQGVVIWISEPFTDWMPMALGISMHYIQYKWWMIPGQQKPYHRRTDATGHYAFQQCRIWYICSKCYGTRRLYHRRQ